MSAPETATRKEEAVWLLEQLLPDTGVNNLSFTFRVDGRLLPSALRDAMRFLLRRHEVLRTTFLGTAAGLTKRVLAEVAIDTVTGTLTGEPEAVRAGLAAFAAEPFRFDGGPMLRLGHFAASGGDVVCLTVHHLIFDAISGGILLGELVAAYDAFVTVGGAPPGLAGEVPALREAAPSQASVEYWRRRLGGFRPDRLDLWCGRQDASGATLAGDQVTVELSAEAQQVVRQLRVELKTSEAVVLLAAYNALLAAHGAGPDLVVGTMVNTRVRGHKRAIGYHVNVVPLRCEVDLSQDFGTLVERASSAFLEGIAHADVPVDSLYSEVTRDGASWRNSLFRHVFNYVPDMDLGEFTIGGLAAAPLVVEIPYSKFDLELFVMSSAEGIRLRTVYSTDVFTSEQVRALLRRYDRLLVTAGAEPRRPVLDVPLWSEHDHAVIDAANRTAESGGPDTVMDTVRGRVAESPDAVAVENGEEIVTYRGLWDTAHRVRHMLVDAGVAGGDIVALAAKRSAELAASVLGVWLAGAVYLPLDPDHPAHRIAYQLADSGATAVLVDAGSQIRTREGVPRLELPRPVALSTTSAVDEPAAVPAAGDPAYLIYTSGSTGRPKGTVIRHGSVANLIEHFRAELGATAADAVLWMTTFSFDISALELLLPLVCGGRAVVAPEEARVDGRVLAELVNHHRVNIVQATPTTWRLVVPDCAEALSGVRVLCGGEPLPTVMAHRLALTGCELRNVYGPTETTIWSTSGVVGKDDDTVRVGRPIRNTAVFVAAPDGRELPVGVRGELCIAGVGVAVGYHDRAELTERRFGEHPRYGRFYHTGDMAQWWPDGTLEVLGRADRQVKLRGNRIELGEVERVLLEHPAVDAAAVVVVGVDAEAALVAFVVTEDEPEIANRLWGHARAGLPSAAVPSEFVCLAELPTTGNHKVDHLALARLIDERTMSRATPKPAEPDDELTAGLVGLWREVLCKDDLTAQSNFFTSGGQSLTAAILLQRIEEELGPRLELAELFTRPTPAELADFLRLGTPASTLVQEV